MMNILSRSKRIIIVACLIVLSVLLLAKCIDKEEPAQNFITNANGEAFAGSQACATCHRDVYNEHLLTAHYLTTRPAEAKYIKGNFDSGKNRFSFGNGVYVLMQRRDSSFYQVKYINGMPQIYERFDIVFGSGINGQTYTYWSGNKLFQLPIFYFAAKNEWANSPGYPGTVIFGRPITARCLECHSTYAQKVSEEMKEPEEFDHNKIIYGVDCEKCHGPGEKHVAFHTQNPDEKKGKYIINPASLSREQNLNLCALCHGGRLTKTKPSFSFEAGDTLSNYFFIDTAGRNVADIDVHGNQFGLLAASKCFQMSQMTCTTCHDPHKNQRAELVSFADKCMNCHNTAHNNFCKLTTLNDSLLKQNCVDCHMPVKSSKAIVFLEQGSNKPATASMRSHLIKVYPDETKKILAEINRMRKKE